MTRSVVEFGHATENLRVLIVDDDWDQAEGLSDLLESRGFQVRVAHGVQEALDCLEDFDVQVALIDVRLGKEQGIDMVRELTRCVPDVLCMMITAYADLDNTIEALKEGVFDFLRKPLSPASLIVSLERCAVRIRLEREKSAAEQEKKNLQAHLRHSQKMEAVGQLAAGVAHEFNNLLVGVLGNAELLLSASDQFPEEFHAALKNIERTGRRAADLTQQLLTFARKKNSKVTVFDVNSVVTDIREMLERLAGIQIELSMKLTTDTAYVCADEADIERAIVNMVINARDAMPDGGTLAIQTNIENLHENDLRPDCDPGPYVQISVVDNGCGMSPEVVDRIFEPFFTTKQVGKGTGLGLSTVFMDISNSGGFVTVDSCKDVGTVIRIHLPVAKTPFDSKAIDTRKANRPIGSNETVLVCDDEEYVLDAVSLAIESMGYTVVQASTPDEAISLAASHEDSISVLLTDLSMPGMNGVELGKAITKLFPELKVLLMSGYGEDVLRDKNIGTQQFSFIQKPAPGAVLARKLREVLDN